MNKEIHCNMCGREEVPDEAGNCPNCGIWLLSEEAESDDKPETNNVLRLDVKEVKVAYARTLPETIVKVLTEDANATMYDSEGGGQYELTDLVTMFDEESDEYCALNKLIEDGYDYLEYS